MFFEYGSFKWNEWEPNLKESEYLRAWEFMERLKAYNLLSNLTFTWEELQ